MSNAPRSARSFAKIEKADLLRLGEIALVKIEEAFKRRPDRRELYENQLLGICLCQGAADHYLNYGTPESRGIHDFDVWAFFARQQDDRIGFWNRKGVTADFGPSKFGRSALDPEHFVGRRVDVFWRAIDERIGLDPFNGIHLYLAEPETASSRALSTNPAIVVWPTVEVGWIAWEPPRAIKPLPANYEWTKM